MFGPRPFAVPSWKRLSRDRRAHVAETEPLVLGTWLAASSFLSPPPPPPDLALAWHGPRSFSLSTRRHLPNVLATPPGASTSGHPVKLRTGKRGHAAAESHAAEFC